MQMNRWTSRIPGTKITIIKDIWLPHWSQNISCCHGVFELSSQSAVLKVNIWLQWGKGSDNSREQQASGVSNLLVSIRHQNMCVCGAGGTRLLRSLFSFCLYFYVLWNLWQATYLSISQFPFIFPKMLSFPSHKPVPYSGPLGATEIQKYSNNTKTPLRSCFYSICRQSHLIIAVWIRFG